MPTKSDKITDWEDIPASSEKIDDWQDIPERATKSGFESGIRGAAQGVSLGMADEVTGGWEALLESAKKGSLDGIGDNYKRFRDESRQEYKFAESDNPGIYLGGELAGGVATAFVPGLNVAKGASLAKTLGTAGALGAGAGFGSSEADNAADLALDSAKGAGLGLAGGAIGHAAIKGASSVPALLRGAKSGAKEATKDAMISLPFVGTTPQAIMGSLKGGVKEVIDSSAAKKEVGDVVRLARQAIGVAKPEEKKSLSLLAKAMKPLRAGEAGSVGELSDDETILAALLSDGDNPVKNWVAQKSASLNPGAGSADDYLKMLNIPSEARATARTFDPKAAAKDLAPEVDVVEDLFTESRSKRFNDLQDVARSKFDSSVVPGVLEEVKSAFRDAEKLKSIPASIKNMIEDVYGIVHNGNGTKLQKLTPGVYDSVPAAEQFNRLQKARELIDGKIKWASEQKEGQAESLLRGVRDSIDDALKTSPEKIEGDALWRESSDLQKKFFDTTKFGQKGNREIDAEKISTLLGNNPTSRRFSETLQGMKDYAKRPDLDEKFREKMLSTIDRIEKSIGVADQQRALSSFRYKQGPSSPAIERLQSSMGKKSLVNDAVNAPAGFLNSADEFMKIVKQRLGTSYQELPESQKVQVIKAWTWMKSNPGASMDQTEKVWKKLIK